MSELLTALVAASKVGFDASKCGACSGTTIITWHTCWRCEDYGWDHVEPCDPPARTEPCLKCEGTGLDASDPERLIGRAMGWLWDRGYDAWDRPVDFGNPEGSRALKLVLESGKEPHDKTAQGRATALLRLVARVGGAA